MQADDFRPTPWQRFCLLGYSVLITLLLPLMLIHLLLRLTLRSRGYSAQHFERFALYPQRIEKNGLLFHCVSVGEVVAVTPLIKHILKSHPELPVTITCTTSTGAAQIRQSFTDKVTQLYLPYDAPWLMARLLKKVQPKAIMVTEVELWPNLVDIAWRRGLPLYLVNARMTDRSARSYGKVPALFTPVLNKLKGVGAQGQRDFDNYLLLGMPEDRLHLTHNLKFDLADADSHQQAVATLAGRLQIGERPVWLAGSTHDPEEQIVLNAYQQICGQFPDLLLILVPRHPQRFDLVVDMLKKSGLVFQCTSDGSSVSPDTQVLMVDQMGMLTALYGLAQMAFVGGSIANRGGHNALEPAVFGIPIGMGPHRHNNPQICDALSDAGALQLCEDQQQMTTLFSNWLNEPEQAHAAGVAGQKVVDNNRGALANTLKMLDCLPADAATG